MIELMKVVASLASGGDPKVAFSGLAESMKLKQEEIVGEKAICEALVILAKEACGPGVEVFSVTGSPALLKGKKIAVLAVLIPE